MLVWLKIWSLSNNIIGYNLIDISKYVQIGGLTTLKPNTNGILNLLFIEEIIQVVYS